MQISTEPRFHVLAVDDSLTDRKLIERLLKISSFQVTTVDSGSKALEFLGLPEGQTNSSLPVSSYQQTIEVNLIITDYCMPGMTGYDLLKKVKESESKRDIPVVIMSSEYTPSRINRCLEGGAEEFFMKPVQLSDMKKLKPYLLKGKSRDDTENNEKSETPSHPSEDQKQQANSISNFATPTRSNKRKAREDDYSPQRTRARYETVDNLAVV